MTNGEWLDYLAHNAPDELAAWFDAEHVETEERALDGDTEPENEDSRERLEADMRELMRSLYEIGYTDAKINHGILNDEVAAPLFSFDEKRGAKLIELLDRQVAITSNAMRGKIDELTAERDELRSQICKLEDDLVRTSDERDNWKANCKDWKKDCERYRSKFGKCLDYADAIHALMDDEGMA